MDTPAQNDIFALYRLIDGASAITVIVHSHPDGDAVGSGIGMLSYLGSMGKDAALILPEACPAAISFLCKEAVRDKILVHESDPDAALRRLSSSDLVICQDFNAFSRTGALESALESVTCPRVLIDHHLDPDMSKYALAFSKIDVSSTAELLYSILMGMPGIDRDAKNLPPLCAEALMTGMTTDTNNFANSVFPSTLTMASELLDAGVDRDTIIENIFHSYGERRIKLLGYLLDKRLRITEEGVAYMILTRRTIMKYGIQEGDTEGFVNVPLSIGAVRMSIFLKEDKDRFRVSIRSKRGTSANRCAKEHFYGGGHELASGGKLMKPDIVKNAADAEKYVNEAIRAYFGNNDK